MNDGLKPNQEEKIIKNMVDCIMDDLDNFYFDELIMKQYKKELFQFFKKISKEYSLFKAGFDFSNKKNIVNDKEKIKEVLGILEIKIKDYEDEHKEFFDSMQYAEASRFKHMKELLEEIKKILEED